MPLPTSKKPMKNTGLPGVQYLYLHLLESTPASSIHFDMLRGFHPAIYILCPKKITFLTYHVLPIRGPLPNRSPPELWGN